MRIKRVGLLTVFLILVTLIFSASAFATVQDFKDFTLDVPDGWTATQDGATVIVIANDKSASVSLTVDKKNGVEAKDLAAAFAKQLNGSEPVLEDEVYHFTFKNNDSGVESRAILETDDEKYLLTVITGDNPEITSIVESMEQK